MVLACLLASFEALQYLEITRYPSTDRMMWAAGASGSIQSMTHVRSAAQAQSRASRRRATSPVHSFTRLRSAGIYLPPDARYDRSCPALLLALVLISTIIPLAHYLP